MEGKRGQGAWGGRGGGQSTGGAQKMQTEGRGMSPAAYQGQQQANGIPKPFNSKTAPVATQRKDGTPGRRKEGGFVEELYTTKLDPEKLSEEQKRRA
ncbi:hypothetical protein GUITHDRAFT_153720, partial [Guillardia theta CCMP2712]